MRYQEAKRTPPRSWWIRSVYFIAACTILITAFSPEGALAAGSLDRTSNCSPAYAVYSTVLDSVYGSIAPNGYTVLDSTQALLVTFGDRELVAATLARMQVSPKLIARYAAAAGEALEATCFHTEVPVYLFPTPDDALRRGGPNEWFISLSPAVFSEDGREAVVVVHFFCGSRCGDIAAVHLLREGDRWRIRRLQEVVTA